jgi:predicted DNA-binding transcriptional regulator
MKKTHLKTGLKEINNYLDVNTGELIDTVIKPHKFLVETKEEFLLCYSSLLGVFMNMNTSEIRVYAYLLQYATGIKFEISKSVREDIAEKTNLTERTVYTTIKVLIDKRLLIQDKLYQINPIYAFKGSSNDRKIVLKAILELEMKS